MPEMLSGEARVIRRLDTRHLARHARKAIRERLGYPAPYALLAVERDGASVVLRLNSGGNALAVESYLRQRGYSTRYDGATQAATAALSASPLSR